MNLSFSGPHSFASGDACLFWAAEAMQGGIYLWTIEQNDETGHWIHYIGETYEFGKRHREHLNGILSLQYGICDVEKARKGELEFLYHGGFRNKDLKAATDQLDQWADLQDEILQYLSAISLFIAPLEADNTGRREVEGLIAWDLKKNHAEVAALLPDDIRFWAPKKNVSLNIRSPEKIAGLGKRIDFLPS